MGLDGKPLVPLHTLISTKMYSVLLLIFSVLSVSNAAANFTSFVDMQSGEIGLSDSKGDVCLSLILHISIINQNINDTNNRVPFALTSSNISGNCAKSNKEDVFLVTTLADNGRSRKLKFYFSTRTVWNRKAEELRWQLRKIVYLESYEGHSAVFESDNSSAVLSAPLSQKYVCKDRINVTLHNLIYKNVIVEFSSEIDVQPYGPRSNWHSAVFESDNSSAVLSAPLSQKYVCKDRINVTLHNLIYKNVIVEFSSEIDVQPYGPRSNLYLCDRTRRRTLRESLDSKSTIASGVVLGLTWMGAIVGHMFRRHFLPERKQIYENLGQ